MSNGQNISGEAAKRYASALLDLAIESKSLKVVEKNLKILKNLFANSDELRRLATSPVLADTDKIKAILAVAKKAKLGKLVTNFVGTVTQNQRAQEIPAIIDAFEQMLAAQRGTGSAHVVSAKKLTPAQLNAIKAQLKKTMGRIVAVKSSIDPDLLGGFTVKVGSQYFDASLKTKLDGLKMAMKEA
ncbi:MAG: F0F1 ATP synthase subunit delta [Robiginitomaculum sp.]